MLIAYLSTFIEFLCFYFTIRAYLQVSKKPTRNDWIGLAVILVVLGTLPAKYATFAWVLGQVLYLLYAAFVSGRNKLDSAFLFCLTFESMLIVQFLAALILSCLPLKLTDDGMSVAGNLTTLILILLLFQIRALRGIYTKIARSAIPYRMILLNSYLVLFSLLFLFKLHPDRLYSNLYSVLIIVAFLIAANACVLYYDQRVSSQKQELLSYQKNLPIYQSLISEIRGNQHEYSNRLQNLQNLTQTCDSYETLRDAIQKYTKQYSKPLHAYPLLQINRPLLAATLYNHSCRADMKEISIQFDVVTEALFSHASETQLSDFISTLTQNAVEACKPGDNIYIHLDSQDGMTKFEIRNPAPKLYSPQDISNFFQRDFTTKETLIKEDGVPHGIGLYNLMRDITKLKGSIGADGVTYSGKNWIIFRLSV